MSLDTIGKMITNLKQKYVSPKLYAVLMTSTKTGQKYVHLGAGYGLEEVVRQARKKLRDNHNISENDSLQFNPDMWTINDPTTVLADYLKDND